MGQLYYFLTTHVGTPWQMTIHLNSSKQDLEARFYQEDQSEFDKLFFMTHRGHFGSCCPYQGGFRDLNDIENITPGEYNGLARLIEDKANNKDLFFVIHENFKDVIHYIQEKTDYVPVSCGTLD